MLKRDVCVAGGAGKESGGCTPSLAHHFNLVRFITAKLRR